MSVNRQQQQIVEKTNDNAIKHLQGLFNTKEWMTLSEAANYIGVSHNTFVKFREKGLKVSQIDGIKRVSRKQIDEFLEKHSF